MIELAAHTDDATIDATIRAIISIYEAAFPKRIRGYYLVGSYGDDSPITGSDIDMEIIFNDALSTGERARCDALKAGCRALSPIHLDLPVKAETDLAQLDTVALKLSSKFVYGEDTREAMPLPSHATYLRHISTPTQRGLTVRFRRETVSLPLDYPSPDDSYFGYIPPQHMQSTTPIKLWVLNVGWLATFLVVHQAQVYVPSKRNMLGAYRQHINDDWLPFLEAVYENGRNRWGYQIPHDGADSDYALLVDLMRQTLAFENYVAERYVAYLKDDLMQSHPDVAQERLAAFD